MGLLFFSIRLAKIKKTGDLKYRGGSGETGIFINYWCVVRPRDGLV